MSNIIRFQFAKGSEVRFLSHLDLVRALERTLRRGRLPIAYSAGFNPRPKMSFGFALPVGVLSKAEFGDFEFLEKIDPQEFLTLYNSHLPQGLQILKAKTLPQGTLPLMRMINAASYEFVLPGKKIQELKKRWQWLQGLDTFKVERKTKKGIRKLDVLPFLFDVLYLDESPQGARISCFCSIGNEGNLRIDELGALLDFSHLDVMIMRTGQLLKEGKDYSLPLGNRG